MAQFTFNFTKAQRNALSNLQRSSRMIRGIHSKNLLKQTYPGARIGFQESTEESIRLVYQDNSLRLVAFNDNKYQTALTEYRDKRYFDEKDSIPERIVNNALNDSLRFLPQEWHNVERGNVETFLNDLYNYLWDEELRNCVINPLENNLFVHCGSTSFNLSDFCPVQDNNQNDWNKPANGFWACPVGEEYIQWKDVGESYRRTERLAESFTFRLAGGSKVLQITTLKDLEKIEKYKLTQNKRPLYSYEQMAADGIDALIIIISVDERLVDFFPSWDVDSLVVFNPDVIEVLDTKK